MGLLVSNLTVTDYHLCVGWSTLCISVDTLSKLSTVATNARNEEQAVDTCRNAQRFQAVIGLDFDD